MRLDILVPLSSLVLSLLVVTAPIDAEEKAPSLAKQIESWTSESYPLSQRINKAKAIMDDFDSVMAVYFTLLGTKKVSRNPSDQSAIIGVDDARALRTWTDALKEEIKASDNPEIIEGRIDLQADIERLGIFSEIFATIAEQHPEQPREDIFQLIALNLYLPHRQYPAASQRAAYQLIQQLARNFPNPVDYAWPQEEPEPAVPWNLELGPRAQHNLLNQIGPDRFRQVLQSLPPQALTWAVDYHGYPNALLENRLSLRIDHQRHRVVIEEIVLNLRVSTPIDEKEDAAEDE